MNPILRALMGTTRIMYEGEGGGGGGDAGGDAGGGGAGGGDAGGSGAGGAGAKPARPDFLPEKFWNAESGEPRLAELASSYTEVERKFRTKNEVLRKEVETAFHTERRSNTPADPDGYKLTVPETLNGRFEIPGDDPLLSNVRTWAHNHGLTHDQFQELTGLYFEAAESMLPSIDNAKKMLGENADDRIGRVERWLAKHTSQQGMSFMKEMTHHPSFVQAMEEVLDAVGEPRLATAGDTQGPQGAITMADIIKAKQDPRWSKADPAYRKEVHALVERFAKQQTR